MEGKNPNITTQDKKNVSTTAKSRFTTSDREPAVSSRTSSIYKSSAEASVRQNDQLGATASVYNSSTCEIDCEPCSTAGDYVLAVGYCSECKEYYCQTCYRVHSRIKATKYHTLMDHSTMPTISTTAVSTSIASMNIKQGSDADDTQFQDKFHFNRDIKNIKHPDEEFDCYIIGITSVTDNELVIIDYDNKSTKMIDFGNDLIVGFIKFDSEPIDITTISNTEVAITFVNHDLIRILSTSGGLSVKRSLRMSGTCLAVQYFNCKLYVSYKEPVKFKILSLSGGVMKTIKPDSQFLGHCTTPRHIAVHPDESKIYVSDWQNNVVLCMDMNGTMLAVYKDDELDEPFDISFGPFGSIYLFNRNNSTFVTIPEDLRELRVILGKSDGLRNPYAMCFCHSKKSLFVSSASTDATFCNVITVYQYA